MMESVESKTSSKISSTLISYYWDTDNANAEEVEEKYRIEEEAAENSLLLIERYKYLPLKKISTPKFQTTSVRMVMDKQKNSSDDEYRISRNLRMLSSTANLSRTVTSTTLQNRQSIFSVPMMAEDTISEYSEFTSMSSNSVSVDLEDIRENSLEKMNQLIKLTKYRWKTAIRMVIMRGKMDKESSLDNFTYGFRHSLTDKPINFDPGNFKQIKEKGISSEVKYILNLPPEKRNIKQINMIVKDLQKSCLTSFSEYPLYIQQKFAKIAQYEIITPKRAIVRQGNLAENFYFILDGRAVAKIMLYDIKNDKTEVKHISTLRKGASFGEYSLLRPKRHLVSVTSENTMTLLRINREIYYTVMYNKLVHDIPEHVYYLSHFKFMKEWPLDLLLRYPMNCLKHYYRNRSVVVTDSLDCQWIYVIRHGSCMVLKEIVQQSAELTQKSTGNWSCFPKYESKIDTGLKTAAEWGDTCKIEYEPLVLPPIKRDPAIAYNEFPTLVEIKKDIIYNRINEDGLENKSMFVQIDMLKEKDVFGLSTINFDEFSEKKPLPSVSLVSRGAEVVMLNKEFFVNNISEKSKWNVRKLVSWYPDNDTFRKTLQSKLDWERYKKSVVANVVLPQCVK